MKKHKVITICGSGKTYLLNEFINLKENEDIEFYYVSLHGLKNIDEIKAQTEKLSLAGNCVLSIIYATHDMSFYTEEDIKLFKELHFQRIAMSDAIFVVNVDGYIGKSTQNEIEYAKSLGKEILYLEEV